MNASLKLRMDADVANKIRAHAMAIYPDECCGALFGKDTEGNEPRKILQALPLANQRSDAPRNRFSIAPMDVMRAETTATAQGLLVVGWYHSHPDHPAHPSEYDREHALPWYSYVIVSVQRDGPTAITSWRLLEERAGYLEEIIEFRTELAPGA